MIAETETMQETLTIVTGLPLFRGLDAAELERIAATTQRLAVAKGSQIFARGDPCMGFHVVLGGQIKLAMSSERGDEKVIEIIGPGQSFGEAVMFLDKPYIVFAEALSDARLLFIAKDAVLRELDRDPQLIRRFLGSLSLRLRHLLTDIENYSLLSGRERVVGFLLNGASASDRPDRIRLPFKKSLVASRLNVTQEHFSRILHQLGEEGLIDVDGSTIHLLDPDRLRRG